MIIKLFENYTDYNSEIEYVKDIILQKAVDTNDVNTVDFFINKGYDFETYDVLYNSLFSIHIFKLFLEKGIDVNEYLKIDRVDVYFKNEEFQKILIDFGYGSFIYEHFKFNDNLRNDPKYKNVIERFEDMDKYNI